jgi:hypothetical protein
LARPNGGMTTEAAAPGIDPAANRGMVLRSSHIQARAEAQPTIQLSPETADAMRDIVRAELERVRGEVRADVRQIKSGGILLGVALVLFTVALSMFDLAVVIALGGTVGSALLIAFIVVGEVLVIGYLGYRRLPRALFDRLLS